MSQVSRVAAVLLHACVASFSAIPVAAHAFPANLFGYRQTAQDDVAAFPQWLHALERQLRDDLRDGDCSERRINRCHMAQWLAFPRAHPRAVAAGAAARGQPLRQREGLRARPRQLRRRGLLGDSAGIPRQRRRLRGLRHHQVLLAALARVPGRRAAHRGRPGHEPASAPCGAGRWPRRRHPHPRQPGRARCCRTGRSCITRRCIPSTSAAGGFTFRADHGR